MHLELTQVLTCPFCGPEHGLIAFVDRMEERRILAGHLDCPTCERRHAVRDATVYLSPGDGGRRRRGGVPRGTEAGARARAAPPEDVLGGLPESAPTAAALLGSAHGPETLLLAGGAGPLGPAIADLRPEAAVLTYGPSPAAVHPRVYPVVPTAPDTDLPFRFGSFDGAVLAADHPELVAGIAHLLRRGARLVVLGPRGDLGAFDAGTPLRELAADERAWVGIRE